jgi:riboflavin transporter FmnP
MKQRSVQWLVKVAVLGALATVLMLVEFPLMFLAPNFYKLDLSEIPVVVGAFALGPMAGVAIEAIKVLLNFALEGTVTAGVGEIANFLIGCSYVVPAAIFYAVRKSRKSAIIGMIAGTLSVVVVGAILNAYVLLPAYAYAYGAPIDAFIAMGSAINPAITDLTTFILFAVVPFNLFKGLMISAIVLVIYKRVSPLLKGRHHEEE